MTIDEVHKAKREAAELVCQILEDLQRKTGTRLRGVDVSLVHWEQLDGKEGTLVERVRIELKV